MITFAPGQRLLDRYRIEAFVARGGMGDVYLGRHETLGHRVAVKMLHTDEVEYHRRFEREARMMARVQHPNVVSIIDVGHHEHVPYIVMHHAEGEPLDLILQRERCFSWPEAVDIAASIFEGLAAIHAAGIVHRDVKPGNVLVGPPPLRTVTLIDFSIALPDKRPEHSRHTGQGVVLGTPDYMAPEQVLGDPVDARADIYATGICMFEMISGRLPYRDAESGGISSMLDRVRNEAPRLVAMGGRDQPPRALVELVADCVAIDPGMRPADATALAMALRAMSPSRGTGSYVVVSADGPTAPLDETISDPHLDLLGPNRPGLDDPGPDGPAPRGLVPDRLDPPAPTPNGPGPTTEWNPRGHLDATPPPAATPRPRRLAPADTRPPTQVPQRSGLDPVDTPLSVRVSRQVGAVHPADTAPAGAPVFKLRAAIAVRFARGTLADPLNAQLLGRLVGRRGHSIVADDDLWVALLRSPSRGDALRRVAHLKRFVEKRFAHTEAVRWTELPDTCTTETLPTCLGQLLEPLRTPGRTS